jgi:hypothetical protein
MDKSGGHHSFYRTESGLPQWDAGV